MTGCITKCTSFSRESIDTAWEDIRYHFGPRTEIGSDTYVTDMLQWNVWAISKGVSLDNVNKFGFWLIWKCSYGTTDYGNLPSQQRDHVGLSAAPCPFDSSTDPIRVDIMLGYIPDVTTDHGNYYMRVTSRGGVWGFECTYSGCPYLIEYGQPYFYV